MAQNIDLQTQRLDIIESTVDKYAARKLEPSIYVKCDGEMLALHATTEVSVSYPSSVTSFPVESGATITDNIIRGSDSVTFSGVITDLFTSIALDETGTSVATDPTVDLVRKSQEYVDRFKAKIDAKKTFDVYFGGSNPIKNCVATDFNIKRDKSVGNTGYIISINFQQVRFKSASEVSAQPNADFAGIAAKLAKAGKPTQAPGILLDCAQRHLHEVPIEEIGGSDLDNSREKLMQLERAKRDCTPGDSKRIFYHQDLEKGIY